MENRKEFRSTNRGRFESEYRDQFHIVICTYSYNQTDIWKSREQWYLTTQRKEGVEDWTENEKKAF